MVNFFSVLLSLSPFIILCIFLVIINKKEKKEKEERKKTQALTLILKARTGTVQDQQRLVEYYQKQTVYGGLDQTDASVLYYWLWVLSYNGNKEASTSINCLISEYCSDMDEIHDPALKQIYAQILEKIYKAEISAYEDRKRGEKWFFVKGEDVDIEENHSRIKKAFHKLQSLMDVEIRS